MTTRTIAILLAAAAAAMAGNWTDPVEVLQEFQRCVAYRARLNGSYLIVEATHEKPWHTYAMDNKQRAAEKLAGRPSLGIDGPTEFKLTGGLEVAGPWRQTPPKDYSKPDLQWYTWGFDNTALFVAKVKRTGAGPARIGIRGQACTETSCKNIDLSISLPITGAVEGEPSGVDLKSLVPVR